MHRILIDTNIIIFREDIKELPKEVQELLKILNRTDNTIVIHPLSLKEIKNDKNVRRREIVLSKVETYQVIESPPNYLSDENFISLIGKATNMHDIIDNNLLYCVYRDVVDFLITEDEKIHKKAIRAGISDRVFRVSEACEYFRRSIDEKILHPPPLQHIPMHNLDLRDSIFDSLREEYKGFNDWWRNKSREGRKAWVHYVGRKIGAILILKEENEPIDSIPPLPKRKRLKICTLKVDPIDRGSKIGELFIKISIQTAIQKNIDEIYLTHFTKPNDFLVALIEEYGFHQVAKKNGEDIFVKRLVPDKNKIYYPYQIYKEFYPSFYDGKDVNKFIVPIRPEWHNRLFTDYKRRQLTLSESAGEFIVEGNTIKKAYLSHSKIKGMKEGDILLFYRSKDIKGITSLGIVEKVYENITNPNVIISYVGKRSVYSRIDIKKMSVKPVKIILFWWNTHFDKPLVYNWLLNSKILAGPPQAITKITHEQYLKIKEVTNINERYTVN